MVVSIEKLTQEERTSVKQAAVLMLALGMQDMADACVRALEVADAFDDRTVEELKPSMNEQFELLAERFHRETGLLAPGKDRPAASGALQADDVLSRFWEYWEKTLATSVAYKKLKAENERLRGLFEDIVIDAVGDEGLRDFYLMVQRKAHEALRGNDGEH